MSNPDELKFQIAISLIPGIGSITARTLIAYAGSAESVFREKEKNLIKIPGIGETLAKNIKRQSAICKAAEEVEFILKNNIHCYFYLDSYYPRRLKNCSDAPIVLFSKGNANLNEEKIISVVGTRNATDYGKEICKELIHDISARPYSALVISGLAYGIDICAHKACLEFGVPTVGVFAHGLDKIYPSLHASYAKKMLEQGGLVTDFTSKSSIDRQNFLRRNRIIAGLADATIIVESADKGGALVTADIANSYNRDVFAFPGKSKDTFSRGCNNLIKRNEAVLIESYSDIEMFMGWEENINNRKPVQSMLFVDLSENEQILVDALRMREKFIDEICSDVGLPMSLVSSLLLDLEFKGVVISLPGKIYQLR